MHGTLLKFETTNSLTAVLSLCWTPGLCNSSFWGTDFEDGSKTGTKLEVKNGLHSVPTIPEVNVVSPFGAVHDPERGVGS